MKKKWEEPRIVVQKFTPNEYVAACYVINCNVPGYGYIYAETNGEPGLQRDGRNPDEFLVGPVSACNRWHKGVIQDNAPEANGYWYQPGGIFWGSSTTDVYWWEEDLGSSSDIHATTVMDREWQTNPNAS